MIVCLHKALGLISSIGVKGLHDEALSQKTRGKATEKDSQHQPLNSTHVDIGELTYTYIYIHTHIHT